MARNLNIAIYSHIVYDEFFPLLVGDRFGAFPGYNQNKYPQLDNIISAAVFRYGHSTLTEKINKL